MSETNPSRTGRFGAVFVIVIVAGSALGVLGWHLLSNRGGSGLDMSGFDLEKTPESRRPTAAAAGKPQSPASSMGMLKADAGVLIVDGGSSGPGAGRPSGATAPDKRPRQMGLTEAARKYEAAVRRYARRETAKHPIIREYGREWMSHPDLKKLNDDYMRDKDPLKFLAGLSKSENLGKMIKKYAGKNEIRQFIVQGSKEAPADLAAAAVDALKSDRVVKDLILTIFKGLGIPLSSITAIIAGGDPSKLDKNRIANDILNDPELKKAQQQSLQAPAVDLHGR